MAPDRQRRRYARLYARLIRLYPRPFRERFGEGMAQTFDDLCREREDAGHRLLGLALRTYGETTAAMVRERMRSLTMQQKAIIRITLVVAALLAIPLVAMRFTDVVVWSAGDFVVAGALLFGTGLAYERVAKRSHRTAYRVATGLALGTALLLVWANLAVGIIGSESNPANMLYFGVVAVGIIGAALARFRPRGMASTLFATALAQALVPLIALVIWRPLSRSAAEPVEYVAVLGIHVFFVGLFVVSGLLFRHAGAAAVQGPRAA